MIGTLVCVSAHAEIGTLDCVLAHAENDTQDFVIEQPETTETMHDSAIQQSVNVGVADQDSKPTNKLSMESLSRSEYVSARAGAADALTQRREYAEEGSDLIKQCVLNCFQALNVTGGILRVIFDSGCTNHMLPLNNSMTDYRPYTGHVSLGDARVKLDIIGVGHTPLLKNVLHVPRLSFGLISIGRLTADEFIVVFHGSQVTVFYPSGEIFITGMQRYGSKLYFLSKDALSTLCGREVANSVFEGTPVSGTDLQNVELMNAADTQGDFEVHGSAPKRLRSATLGLNALELLHRRWGHASEH